MSLKKDISPSPAKVDTACFGLLGVLIALYMLAGAVIFSSLERSAEIRAHHYWNTRFREFSHVHNLSNQDLKSLLRYYEEARMAGVRVERSRALWDIPGAFYFVGTVVSTIGFGVTAPSTIAGKVLLVFYGLFGCSATILFFNLFLERVLSLLSFLLFWCHSKRIRHSRLESGGRGDDCKVDWKPPTYQISLVLFFTVIVVACGAALLYSAMEGWTYLESLYFCFVAFSTVGFGDFVSVQRKQHEVIRAYQVANCVVILLGVCCTYSLFNSVSVLMRQGLNCIMRKLARAYSSVLVLRCLSGSICCPHASDACCCDVAKLETVCNGEHTNENNQ